MTPAEWFVAHEKRLDGHRYGRRPVRGLYCITEGTGLPVKVGISSDAIRRIQTYQSSTWRTIYVCWVVEGRNAHEGALKRVLKEKRIHGEWFLDPYDEVKRMFAGGERVAHVTSLIASLAVDLGLPVKDQPVPREPLRQPLPWRSNDSIIVEQPEDAA